MNSTLLSINTKKEAMHIPCDGHIWYANTRKYHNAFNGGEEDRIHLVATLLGEK